jgi:hypothetical protein
MAWILLLFDKESLNSIKGCDSDQNEKNIYSEGDWLKAVEDNNVFF